MKRILFVCKHNRFRSVLAEGFFRKYNVNKNLRIGSGGILRGKPINKNVKAIARRFELKIKAKPQGISDEILNGQDIVVVVADNVPAWLFRKKGRKVIWYKIRDADNDDIKEVLNRANLLDGKMKELARKLS